MDNELQSLLVAVLASPDDRTPRLLWANRLSERGDSRAGKVQKHCETGDIHLRSYRLAGDVEFLVLQFVPQSLAVEFGCRCAERVLPVFHQEWPDDSRPEQLVSAVRGWLRTEQTKKRVHELAWGMAELVDDAAAVPPAGVVWDRERESQRGLRSQRHSPSDSLLVRIGGFRRFASVPMRQSRRLRTRVSEVGSGRNWQSCCGNRRQTCCGRRCRICWGENHGT